MRAIKFILPAVLAVAFFAGLVLAPTHVVKADTFCTGGYHFWSTDESFWDSCLYYYTANIDKDTYAPGETIQSSGAVQTSMCANEGSNNDYAELDGNANYSGEAHTLLSGNLDETNEAAFQDTFNNGNGNNDNVYGTPMYGDAQFTAPNDPGKYHITFNGTGQYIDSDGNGASDSNSIQIPFRVSGPVCVGNSGSSCSSPQNSCGQTETGTVQCDGSCSASTPQCTCPTGQTLSSSGTCVPITCPAGKALNSSGKCVQINCPTGQTLSGSSCVPIICPTGQKLDGNNCNPIICPAGKALSGNNCVPIVCPAGQALSNGACVPISCPPGQTLNSHNACIPIVCATGKSLNSSGVCVANTCPAGETMNSAGTCVGASCPAGKVLNSNGSCVSPSCPSGQSLNSSGVCIPNNSCPQGKVKNSNGTCVAITCPSGQEYSASANACIAVTDQCVSNAGQTCVASNSCSMTNIGTTNCDGSCSVNAPSNNLCASSPTLSFVASPTRVRTGSATSLSWSATGVKSCTVRGTNGFSSNLSTGTNENSGAINKTTVFTFTCVNQNGDTSSVTQTVQPLPVYIEQ